MLLAGNSPCIDIAVPKAGYARKPIFVGGALRAATDLSYRSRRIAPLPHQSDKFSCLL
jgi:hypothetical protein